MPSSNIKQYFHLVLVILVAVLLRLYFQIGHIFSDDSYYSFLSFTLLKGDFANEYLGYPVFPLRMAFIGLTAFSMKVFGITEFATLFFQFLFSLLNILLVYKTAQLFTSNNRIAIYAALLIAFFPTDVIFASIGFPDLINIFFINLGIYFLLKSHCQKKFYLAFIGGFSFFLSMQFKENTYYTLILLFTLFVYSLIKNKNLNLQLLIGIFFIGANYLVEGFAYLLLHNDFLYRITITNLNYHYSFYDFFPFTAQKLSGSNNYFRNLFDQIFLINVTSIFPRRFYLFLPIATSVQTYINFRKKEQPLLNFWFWGTAILMIFFTTSFNEYKPLDLARSWYIYPLLMPMLILSSIFINRFSKLIKNGLMVIYILGSLIMCFEYENFFDKDNLNLLKSFLRDNPAKMIYTDHFTKYSIDLIREYKSDNSNRILGNDFDFKQINNGDWVLFSQKHIAELRMQKHQLPDFKVLTTSQFKHVASFNDFIFYEKLH